ncbi:MAG: sugar transferase [bacterium]|nr:sugar transferase [bacterium]
MQRHSRTKQLTLLFGDIAILYLSLGEMLVIRYWTPPDIFLIRQHFFPFSFVFFMWVVIFYVTGLYDLRISKNTREFSEKLIRAMAINTLLGVFFFYFISVFEITPRRNLFLEIAIATPFLFVWRMYANHLFARSGGQKVLFFGLNDEIISLAQFLLNNPQFGYRPTVFMAAEGEHPAVPALSMLPVIPFNHSLTVSIQKFAIDTVVISQDIRSNQTIVRMFFEALPLKIGIVEFADFYESITGKIPVSLIGEVWFLENLTELRKNVYDAMKRAIDMLTAFFLGIVFLLLFPVIALCIKLDTRGPIFYRQKRVGEGGVIFEITKFRSMVADAEMNGARWADEDDPRVTRAGIFLRKTRLDELPQILAVLKGDMSFVGPRPERPEFVDILKEKIPFYAMRHLVKPGLTGWAQVNFPYGSSVEDAMEKLQYDLFYIKNRSFVLDAGILFRTIMIIVTQQGR